jgi:hypothetical protein
MDYLCVTVLANPNESEPEFKTRLTAFWSHLLRSQPETYDAVFAEGKNFETANGRVSRAYAVEAEVASAIVAELTANNLATLPVDEDDTYTKYECSGADWFQIAH